MFKIIAQLSLLLCIHTLYPHLIHEAPTKISQKELITLQNKWVTHFMWTKYNFIRCSFSYENNQAGFAIYLGPIPVYCKNYRIFPTKEELRFLFSHPSYFFAQPLHITNSIPQVINIDTLETIIKNKKVIFYTGAGISANSVATMNHLESSIHINQGLHHFFKTAWNNPNLLIQQFTHFCESAINGKPTKAHWALKNIAEKQSSAIITENIDLLQQKTGIKPICPNSEFLYTITENDWKNIDVIICIGLSHDDRGLLNFYKTSNPTGKIIAIDLKTPIYLSNYDYICIGDIQEIVPQLQDLL